MGTALIATGTAGVGMGSGTAALAGFGVTAGTAPVAAGAGGGITAGMGIVGIG